MYFTRYIIGNQVYNSQINRRDEPLNCQMSGLVDLGSPPPMLSMGAAHLDRIVRLHGPTVPNRSNPVSSTRRPGGVASNVAVMLAQLGLPTTLCAAPLEAGHKTLLQSAAVCLLELRTIPRECVYTAVLDIQGELIIGLADMEGYAQVTPDCLPPEFPGTPPGFLFLDACLPVATIEAAARQARASGWKLAGGGTSPAKVGKLAAIDWNLLVLNEAEAAVLTDESDVKIQAGILRERTGGQVGVTRGSAGAVLAAEDGLHSQPSAPIKATDANGAGDIFTATLIAGMAAGVKPVDALRLATYAGSLAAAGKRSVIGTLDNLARLAHDCPAGTTDNHPL